uniref:Tudor domain-containing protein n=1 Tax=Strongyloides papillosus TaxID=174720 RepID=A0A0N5B5P6_STREA
MTSLKSAYKPFIENLDGSDVGLPLMVSAILWNDIDSERYFSLKALKYWDIDEEKLSSDFSNVIDDNSLIPIKPEDIILNKYYLHYDDHTQRFTRVKVVSVPKIKNNGSFEITVFFCDSSTIYDIGCTGFYEIPDAVNALIDCPLHFYCQLPSSNCLELLDLPNCLDFDHMSVVRAMILGNSNVPTAVILEAGPGEIKFNIKNMFSKIDKRIDKSWSTFVEAMNTGEIRQILTKISECGTYEIAPQDDVYIVDVDDFDAVHVRSTLMSIAECFYSSYLQEYFEIENFRERQEVPPNDICLGCVYIAYIGYLKRFTRVQVVELSSHKDRFSLKTIDYPGNEIKSVKVSTFKLYYLIQGLDIPPLYRTVKISSVEGKSSNDKDILINVASKGGRYTLTKSGKSDLVKLVSNIPNEEYDFMEKVMKEIKDNSGVPPYFGDEELRTGSCRLKAPVEVKRCGFNQSMSSVKGRLKLRCVAESKKFV